MARQGVLVIGSMNFDAFYKLPRHMRMGENLHAVGYQTACGGKGANQAVQCAKLGIPTRMVGFLGRDPAGDRIYAEMSAYGVDMALTRRVDVPTGNAAVWVYPGGSVQAALFGGANMAITTDDVDQLHPAFQDTALVILQNEIPINVVEYSMAVAKSAGCMVIYNAAPALAVAPEVVAAADVFVVNEAEMSFYCGSPVSGVASAQEGVKTMLPQLGGTLIVTLGKRGSLVADRDAIRHVPALSVQAVETTGAGDSYVGALAYGLLKGWTAWESAAFATRAAAFTVSSVGAQLAMPTLDLLIRDNQA